LTVARLLRPHGRRGEIAAEILTDFPERLTKLAEVWLWNSRGSVGGASAAAHRAADSAAAAGDDSVSTGANASGAGARKVAVRRCWLTPARGGQAIFHFSGVESIDDAEKLRGLEVQVPMAERVPLAAGSYYISDLAGCEVWEAGASAPLGIVRGAQTVGTPVLEVETPEGEVLIPLAVEICTRIDTAARRIDVTLPEGLLELNKRKAKA
jgi:16S rRNA processing protein RimM